MAKDQLSAVERWRWARRCASRAPNVAGRTHWQRWQAARAQVHALRKAELARALRRRVPLVMLAGTLAALVAVRTPAPSTALAVAAGTALVGAWCCRGPIRRFRAEVPAVRNLKEKTLLAWWTAQKLAPLERRDDFAVVHDLSLGGTGVLDHVVVGPHFVEPVFALSVATGDLCDEADALVTAEGRAVIVWDDMAAWVREHVLCLADVVGDLGFATCVLVLLHGPQNFAWWERTQDQIPVLVATFDAATDHFVGVVADGWLAHPPPVIAQVADAVLQVYPPRNETVDNAELARLVSGNASDAR